MSLREDFLIISNDYLTAKSQVFAGHTLAKLLRADLPERLEKILEQLGFYDYDPRGSAGQGRWVDCPWVAILDPAITDSPQREYYPVYLFREDLTGFYLSLNQGMTEAKINYKSSAKEALRGRAADFRNRLGKIPANFPEKTIDLRASSGSNDSTYYEAGNICAKFYDTEALPEEETFLADLAEMMRLYSSLTGMVDATTGNAGTEDDEQNNPFIEDLTAFRFHKRIERNPKIAQKVKDIRGYICEACHFDFEKAYPGLEKNKYIEAHHLIPVAKLKGSKVVRNPKTDFAVLCANCHRMIHRSENSHDLATFKASSSVKMFPY